MRVAHRESCKLDDLSCLGVQICDKVHCHSIYSTIMHFFWKNHVTSMKAFGPPLTLNWNLTCALQVKHHKLNFPLVHHPASYRLFTFCKLVYRSVSYCIKSVHLLMLFLVSCYFLCGEGCCGNTLTLNALKAVCAKPSTRQEGCSSSGFPSQNNWFYLLVNRFFSFHSFCSFYITDFTSRILHYGSLTNVIYIPLKYFFDH